MKIDMVCANCGRKYRGKPSYTADYSANRLRDKPLPTYGIFHLRHWTRKVYGEFTCKKCKLLNRFYLSWGAMEEKDLRGRDSNG
jgi:hypothetical protein